MDTTIQYRYITSVPDICGGEPIIKGTRVPVRIIVETWRRGILPEEIPDHFPTVRLAEVFEALSYFSDNQDEIMRRIELNRAPHELIHPLVRDL